MADEVNRQFCLNSFADLLVLRVVLRQVSLTSLSLVRSDGVTVEGIESLVGLRVLSTLDVSGCKATSGWMKAIAKLPALEKLILRGCAKVCTRNAVRMQENSCRYVLENQISRFFRTHGPN